MVTVLPPNLVRSLAIPLRIWESVTYLERKRDGEEVERE